MYGSYAITFIPNTRARVATSPPIRPSPTIPRVLPLSSEPSKADRSHLPACIELSARGMCRSREITAPKNNSTTAIVLPAGALMTATPRDVAVSRAMLSTPTPARPTTFSFRPLSNRSAEIRVALRPTIASYSAMRERSSSFCSVGTSSTTIWGSAERSATPSASISSVTRTR